MGERQVSGNRRKSPKPSRRGKASRRRLEALVAPRSRGPLSEMSRQSDLGQSERRLAKVALRQEEGEQDDESPCPVRPPGLRALQPRHWIERDPHCAHQRDVCCGRWHDTLHDQCGDRGEREAQNHHVQAAPSARPPGARILRRTISAIHRDQSEGDDGRQERRCSYPTPAQAEVAPSGETEKNREAQRRERQPPEQSTSPKNKDSWRNPQESLVSQRETVSWRTLPPDASDPILAALSAEAVRAASAARGDQLGAAPFAGDRQPSNCMNCPTMAH